MVLHHLFEAGGVHSCSESTDRHNQYDLPDISFHHRCRRLLSGCLSSVEKNGKIFLVSQWPWLVPLAQATKIVNVIIHVVVVYIQYLYICCF